jgi:recombination protein RecA
MERKTVSPVKAKNHYFTEVKKDVHEYIHSGATLLDCVLGGGFPLGRMSNIVGDASSGKSLLCIEAAANFHNTYPNGKIIYLEAEAAFDEPYAEALGMPIHAVDFVGPELEDFTVEAWFEHLERTIAALGKEDVPCLYIVDSLDALSDRAEKGREIDKGSYGANKPKVIGQLFRRLTKEIERTRIHLMIVSQVRDNIGVMFGERHTRTGGKAMDFYASQIVWLAQIKKLDKTIRKQKRVYGVQIKAKCKKNKIGLPFRECEFPIIFGYGVDNITSMLAWLESIDEEESIAESVNGITYKSFADLAETIKALPTEDRLAIIQNLSDATIRIWQDIENRFIPKHSKY